MPQQLGAREGTATNVRGEPTSNWSPRVAKDGENKHCPRCWRVKGSGTGKRRRNPRRNYLPTWLKRRSKNGCPDRISPCTCTSLGSAARASRMRARGGKRPDRLRVVLENGARMHQRQGKPSEVDLKMASVAATTPELNKAAAHFNSRGWKPKWGE